jgi:hypothetical protein
VTPPLSDQDMGIVITGVDNTYIQGRFECDQLPYTYRGIDTFLVTTQSNTITYATNKPVRIIPISIKIQAHVQPQLMSLKFTQCFTRVANKLVDKLNLPHETGRNDS